MAESHTPSQAEILEALHLLAGRAIEAAKKVLHADLPSVATPSGGGSSLKAMIRQNPPFVSCVGAPSFSSLTLEEQNRALADLLTSVS